MSSYRRPPYVRQEDEGRLREEVARARSAARLQDATTSRRVLGPRNPMSTFAVRPLRHRLWLAGLPAA